ncbi:molybdopterin-binding protein [Oceanomicrobium pacificus]|uniref:Molybdopterin molybdenumtransferase n=1 Tax=Oceanomicrobium pacificus TaxID=2692916 RepID=A0A6B0TYN1_9RHOB|nr:gephyrin-like molybdotransferase Glp [Oceanomicrobium pacificus]MXU64011.1 molybdopterin molybdenumtransferase MoeA [Oceanomicrobium pacificus]
MTDGDRPAGDCYGLPRGVHWTPVDAAHAELRKQLSPVVGQERVPVADAAGRVLAADVAAVRPNPPAANAAVDGYGFSYASVSPTADGSALLQRVAGRAAAGHPFDGSVPAGAALRILTGAPVPAGVDTIILQEDVTEDDGSLRFAAVPKPGANLRAAGEDAQTGATVLTAGTVIGAAEIALLAAVGPSDIAVYRPLRVAILSTGDELRPAGAPLSPGQLPDSNRPMLAAILRDWDCQIVDLGCAPDDPAAIRAALDRGAAEADLILTSGGASTGDEDHVSALLQAEGALMAWRIAMKPGRPLALSRWRGVPVLGLPGNPVAAFVCTLVFGYPVRGLLSGRGWHVPQGLMLPAGFARTRKIGRRDYLRARLDADGSVVPFRSEGSGLISGLGWASGLACLEEDRREVMAGSPVRFLPYAAFGLRTGSA